MRTEFGSWDMVAAKWVLGLIPSEALPRIATDALEDGLDSPSLRDLAGDLHPTLGAAGPLFEKILYEIGVGSLTGRERDWFWQGHARRRSEMEPCHHMRGLARSGESRST